MGYLFVFALLVVTQYYHGYHAKEMQHERHELISEPEHYPPTKNSDEQEPDSPAEYGASSAYHRDSKEDESVPNYDFYKPINTYGPFGPSEEDSKYIPHSETFSKYIHSKETPSSESKHDWKDHEHSHSDTDSEEIPRYGFAKENHHDSDQEHYENIDIGDSSHVKHPEPYKYGASYRTHSREKSDGNKHFEPDKVHHQSYPDHKEEHRSHHVYHHHSDHDNHHDSHHYPEHESYRTPKHKEGHHHSGHKKEHGHHYPEHKEEHGHQYPEHKEGHGHHYLKYKEEHGHHYPEQKEEHGHHYPEHKEEHGHHYPEHKNHHDTGHKEDHHLRYQHWSDINAESFPVHDSRKLIGEIHKSKYHHHGPEMIPKWHGNKSSYAPRIEDFIKEHKLESHKHPYKLDNDKFHHKKDNNLEDSKKGHNVFNNYPHINKHHHKHHHKSFSSYKPEFNVGGHSYGWMYTPKTDLYQQLRKDLHIKMRLLKEHEEKLAELQRSHLQKYRAMFEPPYAKKFLNHELPKHTIPDIEHKHHSHSDEGEKHGHIEPPHTPHSEYNNHSGPEYSSHKPKHHQYEIHHSKHDSPNEESKQKHYSQDAHHYKDDYTS